ncbi:radical SAM protein [candidate division CSSED10-310 bacterium]|uniref:Radical SAM protein n=1 Tax=candidate division CSSED10-310 bacterium TaxID=2855610 RepID=A0ABV6YRZ2_UNCC1
MKTFVPKWLALEITARCNLRCIHCRSSSGEEAGGPEFSTPQALAVLEDIASYAQPVVVLTGGEPLLRGDLFSLAAHGTKLGLRMCLATNGTLVDDTVCERIKETELKMISLSLDGSEQSIHDDFRQQPGAFQGTMKAIQYFQKHGIPFIINSSFTKRNQHDVENVYKLVKKTGAIAWYMFLIVPTGRGKDLLAELVDKEDYEEILNWHYEVEQSETDMLMRPTCAPHYYRIFHQRAKKQGKSTARRTLSFSTGGNKGCVCAQSIAFISSNGDVHPCSYFSAIAGNIMQQSFQEIWENSPLFRALRDFSSYKGRCGQCEYVKVCGGCRARADIIHGDFLQEEPYCLYVPSRMQEKTSGV